jgi:hypothetical protein
MKIGAGVQAILRFCLINLIVSNNGFIDGEGFMSYTFGIGSDFMIYVQSFTEIC